MACEWKLQKPSITIFGLEDYRIHVERRTDNSKTVHSEYENGEKNVEGRRLLGFSNKKKL